MDLLVGHEEINLGVMVVGVVGGDGLMESLKV
jgi:hypothetical protein